MGSHSDGEVTGQEEDNDVRDRELVRIEDQEMAGSYPHLDETMEPEDMSVKMLTEATPAASLRARMRAVRASGSPLKRKVQVNDDEWTNVLQQSVSPRKQDRSELKRLAQSVNENNYQPKPTTKGRNVSDGNGFATSIDLMHSLFGETKVKTKAKVTSTAKGFEVGLPVFV